MLPLSGACELRNSGAALSNEQRKLAVGNRLENFHELQVDAFNGSLFVFKGLIRNF